MLIKCICENEGFPPASFCNDDLHCGQCGGPVAWLTSPCELPNPDPANIKTTDSIVWVYATEAGGAANRFRLPLEFHSLNENRDRRSRPLILSEERCRIEPHNWPYRFFLEFDKEGVDGDHVRYTGIRLKADPNLAEQYGDGWTNDESHLPVGGIFSTLTLVGNCGEQTFGLLACGEPRYEIEVRDQDGRTVQDRPQDDADEPVEHAWAISKRGVHELTVQIRCAKGFLYLPPMGTDGLEQNPTVGKPRDDFNSTVSVPPDRIIGPGRGACEITVNFDSKAWAPGVLQTMRVTFSPDVLVTDIVTIPFYLEPRGEIEFTPAHQYRIPTMHYREVKYSKPDEAEGALFTHIKVRNNGEETLQIRRPRVEPKSLTTVDWIDVFWVKKENDQVAEIECGDSLELGVKVDLSKVSARNHTPRYHLSATIIIESVQQDLLAWQLPVVVQSVEERPELESPLAIDFGNSNSYVVQVRGSKLVPVLGGKDPENFPTVLYFLDVPDLTKPYRSLSKVEIGREAVALGEKNPGSMVRGLLKRWLLEENDRWEAPWPIRTSRGQVGDLSRSDLIRTFIEKVIVESETQLRRTVTKLGLSYPANFSPKARRRLDVILSRIEADRKIEFEHLNERIKFEKVATIDSSPDEASAVAIGFVHDNERYEKEISKKLAADRTFLVASFDFGGGSIDTALLRFKSIGQRLPEFESKHLSLGGDENFGGDNVTEAVSQLLRERFDSLLGRHEPALTFPFDQRKDSQNVGTESWNNRQHLGVLAEALKRHLCQVETAREEMAADSAKEGAKGPDRPPSAPGVSSLERLDFALVEFFGRIKLRVADSAKAISAAETTSLRVSLREAILKFTLDQIYHYQVCEDVAEDLYYTVHERISTTIDELKGFVARAKQDESNTGPLFIVLAGAACRLPLIRKLIEAEFEDVHIVGDPLREPNTRPKSRVAFGLARYLDYLEHAPGRLEKLSRAGHFTHGPILFKASSGEVVEWVPTCFELTADRWHLLDGISLKNALRRGQKVAVYHKSFRSELIGTFDLSKPATLGTSQQIKDLPTVLDSSVPSEVFIKVAGSEDNLLLKIHLGRDESGGWIEYGEWKLDSAEPATPE